MRGLIITFFFFVCHPVIVGQDFNERDLFEEAVACIKRFEGWHTEKDYPYVGYGHKILPGESFLEGVTEEMADWLLRKDLLQKCALFRNFGGDSLLLGVLAYHVGEYTLLGGNGKVKSKLIGKLEKGDRDIYGEYITFRKAYGRIVPSIERRRKYEYNLLFDKTKLKRNEESNHNKDRGGYASPSS